LSKYTDAQRVALAYYNEMRQTGMMDFDALLIYGAQLALNWINPGMGYRVLLVDEVQDSGKWDFQIYKHLRIPHKAFFGDSDQGIYSFRGGNIKNIMELTRTANVVELSRNYRCGEVICQAAQRLIEHNTSRYPKNMLSVTPYKGGVELWGNHRSDFAEATAIAADLNATSGSAAVLLRTNFLANRYGEWLKAMGCGVIEKAAEDLPSDWSLAKLLIAIFQNPDNDPLVRSYLVRTKSQKEAETIHFDALSAHKTINQFKSYWPPMTMGGLNGIGLHNCLNYLGEGGVSADSIFRIRDIINTLSHRGAHPASGLGHERNAQAQNP
jgi:hypothetical protein